MKTCFKSRYAKIKFIGISMLFNYDQNVASSEKSVANSEKSIEISYLRKMNCLSYHKNGSDLKGSINS